MAFSVVSQTKRYNATCRALQICRAAHIEGFCFVLWDVPLSYDYKLFFVEFSNLISDHVTIFGASKALITIWVVSQPNPNLGQMAHGKETDVEKVLFYGIQDVLSSCQ